MVEARTIRSAYLKVRKPLAFVLVIVAFAMRFVSIPVVQDAVLVALGIMVIQMLFELHDRITATERPRIYKEFFDATLQMRSCVEKTIEKKGDISIQWIGMTMHHAWTFLKNILPGIVADKRRVSIKIELCMLDSGWDKLEGLNASWKGRTVTNYEAICLFKKQVENKQTDNKWSIDVYLYRHMPHWHGLLIDNKYLFLSTCSWKDGVLLGGENPYELYERDDKLGGSKKISQFNSWFKYIRDHSEKCANSTPGGLAKK